jgi:hypothetical protein
MMAHWDDSGTAVGYEGKKGDKLIAKSLRGKKVKVKQKASKKVSKPTKVPLGKSVVMLDEGEDLDHLYNLFGVSDEQDIQGVVDGSVGEDW